MPTTPTDLLHDACMAAAVALCLSRGIRSGIDRIAAAMARAGIEEADEIQAELNENQQELCV